MKQSESSVQAEVRLECARRGILLFRNNSGAFKDDTGRVIRFGLGNDSAQTNSVMKSSDLIGIQAVTITPDMVGQTVGVMHAYECKAPGWRLTPGDKRGQAQLVFLNLVRSRGGVAAFVTCVEDIPI